MAKTTVLPDPASPLIRWGPSGLSIAAAFCHRSRFAIPLSIFFRTAPREASPVTELRFLAGLMVVTRCSAACRFLSSSSLIGGRASTQSRTASIEP